VNMPGRLRRSMPFSMSAWLHGVVLGWLVASAAQAPPPARPVKDEEMRPHEVHVIWYHLHEKLPDVSSGNVREDHRPLRARKKFQQSLVAGQKDLPVPPQLIRVAAPKIELPKMLALPNVLAVAPPPKPLKPFQPPVVAPKPPSPALELPDAPQLASIEPAKTLPFDAMLAKPQPRAFIPPPSTRTSPLPIPPELPVAPELHTAAPSLAAPRIPHGFTAPPPKPEMAREAPVEPAPPDPSMTAAAPAPATLAIVGLHPVKAPDPPPPPGSHDASFSGGAELHPTGASETPTESAVATVPGLVARGGAKDGQAASLLSAIAPLSLQHMAASIAVAPHLPAPPPEAAGPRAAHVSSAPNSRLRGRYVYTVAIQMPNVTSHSGSWIVWFADRDPATGTIPADMRAPEPLRKVDPKYIQTAVEERIEGIVRLAAVIRRDGHVERVELLQHLDDRLDRSAVEALSKWEFEPARRDGIPIDVDAVFEIPFRLAPKQVR